MTLDDAAVILSGAVCWPRARPVAIEQALDIIKSNSRGNQYVISNQYASYTNEQLLRLALWHIVDCGFGVTDSSLAAAVSLLEAYQRRLENKTHQMIPGE